MGGVEPNFTAEEWRAILGKPAPAGWPKSVRGVHADSRRIRPGFVFVAVQGSRGDGHRFIDDAVRRGAVAVLTETAGNATVPLVRVADTRASLARLSRAFYRFPDRELCLTGVTGTNGKTSVAGFVYQLLETAGVSTGLIGTVAYKFGHREIPARRTTPGPPELQELLRSMRNEGCSHAVMEVSSHALDQRRVEDLEFDTAVFTNLSRDHLDYHRTMEAYFEAKVRLFEFETLSRRVVGEDSWSDRLVERFGPDVIRCGLGGGCDVRAENLRTEVSGTTARVFSPWGDGEVRLRVPGAHNIRNLLQAMAVLGGEDIPFERILEAVEGLHAAPGRLERIPSSVGKVFVDYAHTPDALDKVLSTLRPLTRGKLTVVFGCGGDRDRSKRAPMVEAAARHADRLLVTTDNPRTEDPEQIFQDMREGLTGSEDMDVIPDRSEAIGRAVCELRDGDVVLIAGKGHETVQEIGHQQIPFDDRDAALRALRERELYWTGVE
jgi:UDP-N-acetylmuramoyl-L-alanyl-D-glutamate--2,6-diaminopimelate ligase